MPDFVRSINAEGIHDRFNLHQEFQPGVNILYGKNGTGKTTLLHILSNILNGDFRRFAFFIFNSITVRLDDNTAIEVKREKRGEDAVVTVTVDGHNIDAFPVEETRRQVSEGEHLHSREHSPHVVSQEERLKPILPTAYFPAFRTMIEAWISVAEDPEKYEEPFRYRSIVRQRRATQFSRDLFGQFVPIINYPSPLEIEQRLSDEIQQALFAVASTDSKLLSRAFLDIFAALSGESKQTGATSDQILEQIRSLSQSLEDAPIPTESLRSSSVYTSLLDLVRTFQPHEKLKETAVPILAVYRDSLEQRVNVQKESFETIKRYLVSVNEFLEGKKLEIHEINLRTRRRAVGIRFDDETFTSLSALSSGERQIVTLIYSSTHMSGQKTVLIDEPEISLHVDWQRRLLKKMSEQLEDRQIIACTHSPIIGADYEGRMFELKLEQRSAKAQVPAMEPPADEDEESGQ